jgi:hypothetical protein
LGRSVDIALTPIERPKALAVMNGRLVPRVGSVGADADLTFGTSAPLSPIVDGGVQPHDMAGVHDLGGAVLSTLPGASSMVSLPVGDMMVRALGPVLLQPTWGVSDLRTLLQRLFPCADIGNQISQAVQDATGLNVLPASVAQTLCSAGVGAIADLLILKIKALTFDHVDINGGAAELLDASQSRPQFDRQSDHIDGSWTWHFVFGGAPADVPSMFSGDRTGSTR